MSYSDLKKEYDLICKQLTNYRLNKASAIKKNTKLKYRLAICLMNLN